ncbi:MAG: hypothetical protein WC822_01255 [Candidatus Paceibacterota bacterium]|jgi:hypothetical protein
MPSVTSLVNTRVSGQDSILELDDANGVQYVIEADSTTGQLIIKRNGTIATGFGAYGAAYRRVQAKTASYTCTVADSGTLFTTTGGTGACTFTLPAVATSAGVWYEFVNTVGQNMVITAPADTMVAHNDATATSVTFSEAGFLIGASCKVTCDGTKWLFQQYLAAEASTPVIA